MDDRSLVIRLLEIGVSARRRNPSGYASPADDSQLNSLGAATIANWLEEMGRYRLIGDVQPHFSSSGAGFRFQVTDNAVRLWSNKSDLDAVLNKLSPINPVFDVFISYATGDSAIADELRNELEQHGLTCFMAKKDIKVAEEWQDIIRKALLGSKRVLVLLTPRSINRLWVLMETGAAWALGKPLILALSQVAPNDLIDPARRHQARVIAITAQRKALVNELASVALIAMKIVSFQFMQLSRAKLSFSQTMLISPASISKASS